MKAKHLYAFIILTSFFIVLLFAQFNYLVAINQANKTSGTDEAIEKVMFNYGFKLDAISQDEPTMFTKIKAIIN